MADLPCRFSMAVATAFMPTFRHPAGIPMRNTAAISSETFGARPMPTSAASNAMPAMSTVLRPPRRDIIQDDTG